MKSENNLEVESLCGADEVGSAKCGIVELAKKCSSLIPESEWEKIPPDASSNLDHYLYGYNKTLRS